MFKAPRVSTDPLDRTGPTFTPTSFDLIAVKRVRLALLAPPVLPISGRKRSSALAQEVALENR